MDPPAWAHELIETIQKLSISHDEALQTIEHQRERARWTNIVLFFLIFGIVFLLELHNGEEVHRQAEQNDEDRLGVNDEL
ncbi:unnamed protein product [Caenorhabditis auriculariae]|uniref:Transmembrane protein n=1 Tax=Caenorhabditis auriculariae TaxID=2777116 RepID=A0A8S1HCU9_9PELO|nr:unnamed protein product [Caenorhabditis auriculariae]